MPKSAFADARYMISLSASLLIRLVILPEARGGLCQSAAKQARCHRKEESATDATAAAKLQSLPEEYAALAPGDSRTLLRYRQPMMADRVRML